MNNVQNILVVNVNWLGDVIFSAPVFRALKAKYPQSKIMCLAVPRVREILECIPEIDEIIIYDEKGRHRWPWGIIPLILELKKRKLDAAFLLHRSMTRALMVFLAGIPIRVGYDEKKRGVFLTHRVAVLPGSVHRSDHYLNVVETFGVMVEDRRSVLQVSEDAKVSISKKLTDLGIKENEKFVVIHPGANWDLKRWPRENFTLLIERLIKDLHLQVVISGGKDDISLVEGMTRSIRDPSVAVLTGKTTLKELMALMQKSFLVISSDSGPLHIASGVGAKVIGIFGPTDPKITASRGWGHSIILKEDVGCNRRACYFLNCPDNVCMRAVTVERVYDAIRKIKDQ